MPVELDHGDQTHARLHRETDHVRTTIQLERTHVQQLQDALSSVLDDTSSTPNPRDFTVERRPAGPQPIYVQVTRGDVAVPMYLTEAEAVSLVEDCDSLRSLEAPQ